MSERPAAHPRKPRPDPVPMRVALGVGAVAAVSVATAGLAMPSATGGEPGGGADPAVSRADGRPARDRGKRRVVRYVHLKPGQTAPPGARVIRAAEPTPRVVIVRRPSTPSAPRRVVTRTRQSG